MRRNDVVLVGKPDMWNFYGRINRLVGCDRAEVIYCGRNWGEFVLADLRLANDYRGYTDHNGRFERMPSLRKLKQMAARYDKNVWRRNRRKRL